MAIAELKEAFILLRRMPLLWIPGIVGGSLAAALWVTLNLYGTFFAGRFMIISGLILLIFTTGMFTIIRNNTGDIRTFLAGGIRYYFRILLPQVVIVSVVILVFILLVATFSLFGISDFSVAASLSFGFMIPTLILTFFYDAAAVFEDLRVYASIRRSIQLVFMYMNKVIAFLFVYLAIFLTIVFALVIVWEVFLFDKLEPLSRYNESQLQLLTPEQFTGIIGPGGMWITAGILFLGILLLIPILYTYKACFFKKLATGTVITQQPTTGEYDSKGRWYKY